MKILCKVKLNPDGSLNVSPPESPQGPERELVPPTRSGGEPGPAEDSREGKAVPPVAAEAALQGALRQIRGEAKRLSKEARKMDEKGCADWLVCNMEGRAAGLRKAARMIRAALPKPASGADALAAHPDLPASTEALTDSPTGGERSGRRNAKTKP